METALEVFREADLPNTEIALLAFAHRSIKIFPESEERDTGTSEELLAAGDTIRTLVRDRTHVDGRCTDRRDVKAGQLDSCVTSFSELFKKVNELVAANLARLGPRSRIFVIVFTDGQADPNESQAAACTGQQSRDSVPVAELTGNIELDHPLAVTLVFVGRTECAPSVRNAWSGAFTKHLDTGGPRVHFGFESAVEVPPSHLRADIVDRALRRSATDIVTLSGGCELDEEIHRARWRVRHGNKTPIRMLSRAILDSPTLGRQRLTREGTQELESNQLVDNDGAIVHEWSRSHGRSARPDTVTVHFFFTAVPAVDRDDSRDPEVSHLPQPFVQSVTCSVKNPAIDVDVVSFANIRFRTDRSFLLFLRPSREGESKRLYYWPPKDAPVTRYPPLEASDLDPAPGIELKNEMQLALFPKTPDRATKTIFGEVWVAALELSIEPEEAGNGTSVRLWHKGAEADARRLVAFQFGPLAMLHYSSVLGIAVGCWWLCRTHVRRRMAALVTRSAHPTCETHCGWTEEGCMLVAILLSCWACVLLSDRSIWLQTLMESAMLGAEADWWRATPLLLTVLGTGFVRYCLPHAGRQRVMQGIARFIQLGTAIWLAWAFFQNREMAPAVFSVLLGKWATGKVDPFAWDGLDRTTSGAGSPTPALENDPPDLNAS